MTISAPPSPSPTTPPRHAKQIYGCLGCSAECGRCARTIKTIIDEALGACAKACCSGCPHSHTVAANDEPAKPPSSRSRPAENSPNLDCSYSPAASPQRVALVCKLI